MVGAKLNFDRFSIDTDAFELRADGEAVAVEPLVLDLIVELARHPGVLRTREDLIETVWSGRIVSDTTISTAVKSARKALGDTDTKKRIIRTVHGRGFQFVGEVSGPAAAPARPEDTPGYMPVLQIRVASLDDTVSTAMTRALEARLRAVLGRIAFLDIVVGTDKPADLPPEALRPTHVLDVALSSIDDTAYADVSLSHVSSGLQKWARHFSTLSGNGVTELVADIGSKAEPAILKEMSKCLARQGDGDPRGLILKAMQIIAERGWNRASIDAARGLLEDAIAKDESIAIAYAVLALLNAIGFRVGMLRHDNGAVERAIENAEKALALESQSSVVLGLAGCAFCDVGQLGRGEPIIDRALDLDPMNGHAHAAKGAALMMRRDFDAALGPLRTSIQISPADSRLAVWGALLAAAELKCGQVDNARVSVERAMSRDDCNYLPRLTAVVVHRVSKDEYAFKRALQELLRIHPEITSDEVRFFVGQKAKDDIWPILEAERH